MLHCGTMKHMAVLQRIRGNKCYTEMAMLKRHQHALLAIQSNAVFSLAIQCWHLVCTQYTC